MTDLCELQEKHSTFMSSISGSLSDYMVVSPLGRGAGSFVYKIKSRKNGKELALKVIDKKSPTYQAIEKRLENERELHLKLHHENIVTLHNSFQDEDNFYLLLEFCERGDLYTYLKSKEKLSETEARTISYQIAKGLEYLHNNKIIHRDLKLANILLNNQKIVKICDFGLAVQLLDNKQERSTLCGTPNYISPEIINKEPYGAKTDCWAFGCILYALVTGNPPFEGESVQETLNKVKSASFEIPKTISKELADLLKRTINWKMEERLDIKGILTHGFFDEVKCLNEKSSSGNKENPQKYYFGHSNLSGANMRGKSASMQMTAKNKLDLPRQTPSLARNYLSLEKPEDKRCNDQIAITSEFECPALPNFGDLNSKDADNQNEHLIFGKKVRRQVSININDYSGVKLNNDSEKRFALKNIRNIKLGDRIEEEKSSYMDKSSFCVDNSVSLANITKIKENNFHEHEQKAPELIKYMSEPILTKKKDSGIGSSVQFHDIKRIGDRTSYIMVTPLNAKGLNPQKYKTKRGSLEINKNGTISLEIASQNLVLVIQDNGQKIWIKRNGGTNEPELVLKSYNLVDLPKKYYSFYVYAKQVIDIIRGKTPTAKIVNEDGKFSLMQNANPPCFEAIFQDNSKAFKTVHLLGTTLFKVYNSKNELIDEIDLDNKNLSPPNNHMLMITKSLYYLNLCRDQMKDKRSSGK